LNILEGIYNQVMSITQIKDEIRHNWRKEEVEQLFNKPFNDLLFESASIHRKYFDPNEVQLSTLMSIKTGSCPEDCKYCPQSAHYQTDVEKEALVDTQEIVNAAQAAKDAGASRFCMGAAWRNLNDRNLPQMKEVVSAVKDLGLETCMTLGMAKTEQLSQLKDAGLDYYNHNIDTSEDYYNNIITTRTFQDRLDTLENIQEAGLKTCCGGIVGMGESVDDRASMLMTLANLKQHPQSVPINRLVPSKGTPFEKKEQVDDLDFIRAIAVARIMMPRSYVRLSAGRETMSDTMQALCFFAGANSIFYGEKLLTAPNNEKPDDIKLLTRLGMTTQGHEQEVSCKEKSCASS